MHNAEQILLYNMYVLRFSDGLEAALILESL